MFCLKITFLQDDVIHSRQVNVKIAQQLLLVQMWCTQPLLARIYLIFPESSKPIIRCYKCVKSVSFESFPVGILTKQACLLQPFLLRTHRLLAFLMQISLHLLVTFSKEKHRFFQENTQRQQYQDDEKSKNDSSKVY